VLSGGVNVFSELDAETGKPDKTTLIRTLQPGDTFGDRTLVAGTPTMESMVAAQVRPSSRGLCGDNFLLFSSQRRGVLTTRSTRYWRSCPVTST
jgi:hypothetical protein